MYNNLRAAMNLKGVTIEKMAQVLNVHRNTIANKLDGESEFTFGQSELVSELLFPEYRPEYLFRSFKQDDQPA